MPLGEGHYLLLTDGTGRVLVNHPYSGKATVKLFS